MEDYKFKFELKPPVSIYFHIRAGPDRNVFKPFLHTICTPNIGFIVIKLEIPPALFKSH